MLRKNPKQHKLSSFFLYDYNVDDNFKSQYNETNVMNFSFSLLRIKNLYMFRALLAHPQEAIHKWHLVYCVRVMSVGCGTVTAKLQPCHSKLILYARNLPSAVV
jgi:hypothetical protein